MYIDTSVAVKLYVEEPDSAGCETKVTGESLASSQILLCEFRSAVLGKVFRKSISPATGDRIWQSFNEDLEKRRIVLIPTSDDIVRRAAEVIGQVHRSVPLRTLDALHLATCLDTVSGPLFTTDLRMADAARLLEVELAS